MLTSESIRPDRGEEALTAGAAFSLGRALRLLPRPDGATVVAERGLLFVGIAAEGIVRVKLFPGASERDADAPDLRTTAAVADAAEGGREPAPFRLADRGPAYAVETASVTVEIDKRDCAVRYLDGSGRRRAGHASPVWDAGGAVTAEFAASAAARYYGLGEKTGFLDKRGERYDMWNSDVFAPHVPEIDALYQSIPFLIVHEAEGAYGVFLDNPGRTSFDMRSAADAVRLRTETGGFDYYWIGGPTLKDVVRRYASLTGRMALPPRWAIGYHQSRYSYMTQDEVLRLARTFREKRIPCDAIHLDIHYMEGYRVFTFDPVRFPDPKAMIAELCELGIRIVPIVDPGVKLDVNYGVFKEGVEHGYFCAKPDGEPFAGPVWPGMSVFPDFTDDRAAAWWGDLHRFYTEMGIEGIWNDMNEPAVFNETKTMDLDAVHGNNGSPVKHGEIHNLYGMLMSKATVEGLKRHLGGRRPFVLTRAGYAGIQRYAAVWTGDNRSFWEHMAMAMPMVLNLGLSGVAFSGPDIGGFAHHATGELLARWTQMGALFPYCRNHSELRSVRQEPWSFGPEIEAICRESIEWRYRLMPLLYSLFREASETGMPVIRPLVLEYPDDPNVANLCDQFLLGDSLLAAPICRPGTNYRAVYLPVGVWYDFWSGERWTGGRTVIAHAPLERMPIYVRGGAILPLAEPALSTDGAACGVETVELYVSGGAAGGEAAVNTGSFELYEDDGATFAYREGAYNLYRFTLTEKRDAVELRVEPLHAGYAATSSGEWRLRFKHLPFVPAVGSAAGEDWRYDPASRTLEATVRRPAAGWSLTIRAAEAGR
jgi:alpha-glucosidase